MRQRYAYEIATDFRDGTWQRVVRREETFSRDPAAIVRALLENWVIEHPDEVSGGERITITRPRRRIVPEPSDAKVRVRLFAGGLHDHAPEPVGIGFLGHDERDFTGPDSVNLTDHLKRVGHRVGKLATDRRVGAAGVALATLAAGFLAGRRMRRPKPRA